MYRNLHTTFWTDPKVRALRPEERYLFLYLITNPHTHVSGLYYLPLVLIEHETGIPMRRLMCAFDTLSMRHLALRDAETETIWVVNMLRYQAHGSKILAAVAGQLKSLHNSSLVRQFLSHYSDFRIPLQYPIEGSSEVRHQDQDQNQNQDQDQEQEKTSSELASESSHDVPSEPPVITIPTNRKGVEYPLVASQVEEWKGLYPNVDIDQELRTMRGWSITHPKQRKTYDGMPKFINGWLARNQNNGRSQQPTSSEQENREMLDRIERQFAGGKIQ